jgi:hypothetical protein
MLYGRFDLNVDLDLHSIQIMSGMAAQWDGPCDLSAHADVDDFPGY